MAWLLDTDTCIWFLRQKEPVYSRVQQESPDDLHIASMTLAELYYGALASSDPGAAAVRIEAFLQVGISVVPFDEAAATEHAAHRFALRAVPVGERDLVIASTATAAGHTLVTGNTREFRRVPGLDLANWAGSCHASARAPCRHAPVAPSGSIRPHADRTGADRDVAGHDGRRSVRPV